MKKLSETYKELGIAFTFPIEIKDEDGKPTYYENSHRQWYRREYDKNGYETYHEYSNGIWSRYEYDEDGNQTYHECNDNLWYRYEYDKDGNQTYFEASDGYKIGTKRGSCTGKIIEIDGKKYKLTEL